MTVPNIQKSEGPNMRNETKQEKLARDTEILRRSYGTRIDYASQRSGFGTATLYCHECKNWFYQGYRSITRGFKTRCKCNYSNNLDESKIQMMKTGLNTRLGHRCLPEWATDGRVPPNRMAE